MGNPSQRVWRFEDFEFREATGGLRHRGESAALRPQAAKLLELLLANAGQVVTREEIQQHLWPDTVVDFEQGLNTAVRQLRRALEEEAASPRYVQTVPRRGYRWIGSVECLTDRARDETESQASNQRSRAWVAAVVLLALAGLAGASWMGSDGPVSGDQSQERRLLVLPLQTLGWQDCQDGSGQEFPSPRDYLAGALTEELISEAASLSSAGIKILGRESTHRFSEEGRGGEQAASPGDGSKIEAERPGASDRQPTQSEWSTPRFQQLQSTLRADYLLKGSLRCSAGQVRVSLRLIDVRDGNNLWGESYDRPLGGLFNIHHQAVEGLASALQVEDEQIRLPSPVFDSPSPDILKAEYLVRKPGRSVRDFRLAHQLFLKAVEENPRDARAHLGLFNTYQRIDYPRFKELLPKARQHLREALRLRPDMARAHAAKAAVDTFLLWDLDSAQESFRRALQLNPQRAQTHYAYAYFFLYQGRFSEAVRHMETALDIDPVSTAVRGDLGWVYFSMRRFREAIRESRRTLELEPDATFALDCLLWSHRMLGEDEEAAQAAIRLAELRTDQAGLAETLKKLPVEEVSRRYFQAHRQHLSELSQQQPVHPTSLAFASAGLEDAQSALQALEEAYDMQYCHFLPALEFDPRFEFLHANPRYQDLVSRIRSDTRLPQAASSSTR